MTKERNNIYSATTAGHKEKSHGCPTVKRVTNYIPPPLLATTIILLLVVVVYVVQQR
jgi:hypothetical protein